jgi:hypothetical protein
MKKFLSRLCQFLLAFYVINSAAAFWLAERVRWNVFDKYHWVCHQEHFAADYVFVGSSRVELGVDPRIVNKVTGGTSVNLGVSGGGAGDQYLLLKKFLDNNKAGCVLLQLDYLTLADYFSYPFRDYVWLSYDSDAVVQSAIIDHRGRARYGLWKTIPFLRFMEFASQYYLYLGHRKPIDSPFDETLGSRRSETPFPGSEDHSYVHFRESELAVKYIRLIVEMCHRKQIRLIVFAAPFPRLIEQKADREVSDARISEIVTESKLTFWDFSRDFYDHDEFFYDKHHMNSAGVDSFSKILGERLAKEGSH